MAQTAATTRASVEAEVERLIDILDGLDAAGEDLEDGVDDEPSLGWTAAGAGFSETDDREADDADDEDGHDAEMIDEDGDDLNHGEGGDDTGIADSDGLNEQLSLEAAHV